MSITEQFSSMNSWMGSWKVENDLRVTFVIVTCALSCACAESIRFASKKVRRPNGCVKVLFQLHTYMNLRNKYPFLMAIPIQHSKSRNNLSWLTWILLVLNGTICCRIRTPNNPSPRAGFTVVNVHIPESFMLSIPKYRVVATHLNLTCPKWHNLLQDLNPQQPFSKSRIHCRQCPYPRILHAFSPIILLWQFRFSTL